MENLSHRESSLWEAWRKRHDDAAFEALVQPDLARAISLARGVGCSIEDAEDAVQDALARLAAESGDGPRRIGVRAWLLRSVRELARTRVRSRKRRRDREHAVARPEQVAEASPPPDVREQVDLAMAELDEQEREAVRLRFLLDLDYREVAVVLGVSENACRIRVHRALDRLRVRLGVGAATLIASLALPKPANASELLRRALEAAAGTGTATAVATTLGVAVMSTASKITIGVAAVLLIGIGVRVATVDRVEPVDDSANRIAVRTEGGADEAVGESMEPAAGRGESPPPANPTIVVTGRVVGDRRFGVEGATVEVWISELIGAARTGPDGEFRVKVERTLENAKRDITVRARDDQSGSAIARCLLWDEDVDVGVIVLESGIEISVLVVDGTQPVEGARVFVAHRLSDNSLPARTDFELSTDAAGLATFLVPHGDVVLQGRLGERRGRSEVGLPAAGAGPHRVVLGPTRSIVVLVVDRESGAPVPDATIDVHVRRGGFRMRADPPIDVPPTNADGVTTLRGLDPDDDVFLFVEAPGFPPQHTGGRPPLVGADERSVRIELEPPVTYRWPVVAGESPVPPDGTEIRLAPTPDAALRRVPAVGRMEGGELVVMGLGPFVSAMATAPNGSRTRIAGRAGTTLPAVVFRAPRSLKVRVLRADGAVASDVFVSLGQGGHRAVRALPTDAEGVARFEDLSGERYDVFVSPMRPRRAASLGGRPHGTVNLAAESGSIVVTMGAVIQIVARVTIDGESRLPSRFSLWRRPLGSSGESLGGTLAIDEDAAAGELRIRTLIRSAESRVRYELQTVEFGSFDFEVEVADATAGPVVVDVPLSRVGSLRTRVVGADRQTRIHLEFWSAETGAWESRPWARVLGLAVDRQTYAELPAGRYRIVDSATGAASDPVVVEAGGGVVEATLDLR